MRYRLRKLIFIVGLIVAIASPFLVAEYKSRTTNDPFILVARELETYGKGGIDVLGASQHPNREEIMTVFVYIPDFDRWTVRKDIANFQTRSLLAVSKYGYSGVLLIIGWDFAPPDYLVQGLYMCPELRRSACVWEQVPGQRLSAELTPWPGIGKP